MKTYVVILLFFISCVGFAQNEYIVKTPDGKQVLLKSDYTWEYIKDAKTVDSLSKTLKDVKCNLADDFEEPKLNNKIQNQLKKGRATISHIKKKVAKDYDCTIDDVLLLSVSEQKERGVYTFCANGTKVTYKRNGSSVIKKNKFF